MERGYREERFQMRVWQVNSPQNADQKNEELAAVLWNKCIEENLIACSFAMRDDPLRYVGLMKRAGAWEPKVLETGEALSKALLRARNSRNGCFAIALVRPGSQAERFLVEGLLTEEQAFGSYVQLIEFVDGAPVIYGEKRAVT